MLANKTPTILVVDGGKKAIEIATKIECNIDTLITDIIMPQMNGRELANQISSIMPFVKALFVSAYSEGILSSHNLCPEGADYIRKPFTKETLLNQIFKVWASSPKWKDLVSKFP